MSGVRSYVVKIVSLVVYEAVVSFWEKPIPLEKFRADARSIFDEALVAAENLARQYPSEFQE